jgi:hypothetical protein
MSFQRSPLRRQTSKPILSIGGTTWDLSNLCSTQNESYSLPPNRRLYRAHQSYRDRRWCEQSIYPSKEDLGKYLPADIDTSDTSDIFDRSRARPRSRGVGHRRRQSLPNGAKEFDQPKSPYSIHDRYSQPLSRDLAARDTDELNGRYYESQEQNYSRWERSRTRDEIPRDPPLIPASISVCSSDVSSQTSRHSVEKEGTPVQIEVYPGEFLLLRGAKETLEAIERGHSKSVFCYACGLGLRCVADCDLVICPDCRIMSPVPRRPASLLLEDNAECEDEEDSTSFTHRGCLPQFIPLWWEEDDVSFHSSKQKSKVCSWNGSSLGYTGGVGLGLRIEHYRYSAAYICARNHI